jgi:hypothetical protein
MAAAMIKSFLEPPDAPESASSIPEKDGASPAPYDPKSGIDSATVSSEVIGIESRTECEPAELLVECTG